MGSRRAVLPTLLDRMRDSRVGLYAGYARWVTGDAGDTQAVQDRRDAVPQPRGVPEPLRQR
eukprot:1566285-Rhodomonas_salina.1